MFLARSNYRLRRLRDAVRLLPVFGLFLLTLPVFWPAAGDGGRGLSSDIVYLFAIWSALILVAAIFARALSRPGSEGEPGPGPGPLAGAPDLAAARKPAEADPSQGPGPGFSPRAEARPGSGMDLPPPASGDPGRGRAAEPTSDPGEVAPGRAPFPDRDAPSGPPTRSGPAGLANPLMRADAGNPLAANGPPVHLDSVAPSDPVAPSGPVVPLDPGVPSDPFARPDPVQPGPLPPPASGATRGAGMERASRALFDYSEAGVRPDAEALPEPDREFAADAPPGGVAPLDHATATARPPTTIIPTDTGIASAVGPPPRIVVAPGRGLPPEASAVPEARALPGHAAVLAIVPPPDTVTPPDTDQDTPSGPGTPSDQGARPSPLPPRFGRPAPSIRPAGG